MTEQQEMKIVTAEPAAFGLLGLAVVTLVAAAVKLGWASGSLWVVPWAFFLGAVAQLITSLMEFKRNNMFGATAFGGYGLFWFALGLTYLWQYDNPGMADLAAKQLGFAFVGYLIFSLYMMVGSLMLNKGLFAVFFFINLLFVGLIFNTFYPDTWSDWGKFAGWAEIGVSISAFYVSAATILNNMACGQVLPLGKPFIKPAQLCVLKDEQVPSQK